MKRVLFVGSKQAGLDLVRQLHALAPENLTGVVTFDDYSDIRSQLEQFRAFCAGTGVPLHVAENRAHSEALMAESAADLTIVCGWYWLIGAQVLERSEFLGLHHSLLPKFRGSSPLIWSIIRGETEVGSTLFSLTDEMDAGDVWAQVRLKLEPSDYVSDVLGKLGAAWKDAIDDLYPRLLAGTASAAKQDASQATFCAPRMPEDGRIDWGLPARAIYDFVRAQSDPYPGAFTTLDGKELTIWRARPLDATYYGTPGQVARITNAGVIVTCGDDRPLELEVVEIDGERRPAQEIIRSTKARLGRSAS